MSRPVHPAALLAVGFFLGWAVAWPISHTTNTVSTEQCKTTAHQSISQMTPCVQLMKLRFHN